MDEAETLLERAIELDPEYAAAHAAFGSVLSERILNGFSANADADEQRARAAAKRALALNAKDPFVLKMSGLVWSILGEPARAIEVLRSAVNEAPFDFGAWGYLGWPLAARGDAADLAELHKILDRLLELAPDHPGAAFWLYHKSVAYTCQQELDAAGEYARRAVDRQPDLSWALLNYANVFGLQGRGDEAREAAERAVQINPSMTPVHYVSRMRAMSVGNRAIDWRVAGLIEARLAE
jgi:adenylate cyclase